MMQETKLNGESLDIVSENVLKLKELFPEIVTEDKVDFDKLKTVLGNFIEDDSERYNFTWKGKAEALRLAQTPSNGTLRPYKEESKNWDTTKNLYIEGENLEVLKLLQKSYYGKIKMIYIDPPYNTGNDFVYIDDYKDNLRNYLEITGQINSEGKKISTNTETSGRYHTNWLNMMYPRLKLSRNLLAEDGVIFISIDDNELSNLKKICDEIFGEENFIDCIIWKKRYGGGAKEKYLVTLHEYVLFYAKNIDFIDPIFIPLDENSIKRYYKQKDENYELRGPYRTHPLEAGKAMGDRKNLIFPIKAPDGSDVYPKRQWLWGKERVENALKNNEIEFFKSKSNGEWKINSKQYLKDEEGNIRKSKSFSIIDDIYTQHGTNEIIDILGNARIFPYPKPTKFVQKLLNIGIPSNGIVLDFFAGSSSTANAIMNLNLEDNCNRKYIMVQFPEPTKEKDEAKKEGYDNICEIGKECIRRYGDLLSKNDNNQSSLIQQASKRLDTGFKVFKLDSSNLIKWDPEYDNIEQTIIDSVENFVPGRNELDLIYEILLKYGINLALPIEEYQVNEGKIIYSIGFGALIICLDKNINLNISSEILKIKDELSPEITRVVFKDNGFATDSDKTNVKETLKAHGIDEFVTI